MDILVITKNGQTMIENVEELSITSKDRGLQIKSHEDSSIGWGWNVTEVDEDEEHSNI